jgi:hypothetical protein
VDQFVSGTPKAHLVTPKGDGMDPPFQRMTPPDSVVVEMRTTATRSFGFFAGPNLYVAISLEKTNKLKTPNRAADREKYREHIDRVRWFSGRLSDADINRTTNIDDLITDDFSRG